MFEWKYGNSQLSDDKGSAGIYVIAAMLIFLLLGLFTTYAYAYKFQLMATRLYDDVNQAAMTALDDNTISDPVSGGIQISDASVIQQEVMANLQNTLQSWPQSSYTLQSLQVYGETDKGSSPPTGFSQPVPGTSIYLTMNLNLVVKPGFLPINTHWTIPLYVMVSSNSYESSTKAWNLERGS